MATRKQYKKENNYTAITIKCKIKDIKSFLKKY